MNDPTMRPYPRFPCADFGSRFEFESYARRSVFEHRDLAAYEQRLATVRETVVYHGTCAPCLRACRFTSSIVGGTELPDKRVLPNWRDQLVCDCANPLNAAERALLHFLQSRVRVSPWTRLAVVAASLGLRNRLGAIATIVGATKSAHCVIAQDLAPAEPGFAELRALLLDSGTLVFTAPFDPQAIRSTKHALGWDYIERLRAAGFRCGTAHCYRSEELGYLGAGNFILSAQA